MNISPAPVEADAERELFDREGAFNLVQDYNEELKVELPREQRRPTLQQQAKQ